MKYQLTVVALLIVGLITFVLTRKSEPVAEVIRDL